MKRDVKCSTAAAIALSMRTVTAAAHEKHVPGRVHVTLGWAEEPGFTGSRNAVPVTGTDATGRP